MMHSLSECWYGFTVLAVAMASTTKSRQQQFDELYSDEDVEANLKADEASDEEKPILLLHCDATV